MLIARLLIGWVYSYASCALRLSEAIKGMPSWLQFSVLVQKALQAISATAVASQVTALFAEAQGMPEDVIAGTCRSGRNAERRRSSQGLS